MKNCYKIFFLLLFISTYAAAQSVSNSVVGTTGGTGFIGALTTDWSVGGTAVTSSVVLTSGQVLTQGFLQPSDVVIQLLLTFDPLSVKTYEDVNFELYATASDGSAIIYTSSDLSVAQIVNGNTVKIVGAGTANILATISGTTISKNQPLVVDKAGQVITFDIVPILYKGDAAYAMDAYSNKGFPVTFANSNPFVVKINGVAITPVDLGTATITASALGNANYNAATPVAQLVEVKSHNGDEISVPLVVTPNGDGINDVLLIKGIENFPDNRIVIVNRNGTKIFEVIGYDNTQTIFLGKAKFGGTFGGKLYGSDDYLPAGTYFYSLKYLDGKTRKIKTGYFVLKY